MDPSAAAAAAAAAADNQLRYLESGMDLQSGTCLEIVGRVFAEGQERDRAVQKLRAGLGDYIRQDHKYRQTVGVLNALEAKVQQWVDEKKFDEDVDGEFDRLLRELGTGLDIDEVTVAKHERMKNFEVKARRTGNGGLVVPGSSQVEIDDDISTTQVSVSTIDPVTRQQIKDPVRNRRCGHLYDKGTMLQLVQNNAHTRCPTAGCPNKEFVMPQDLEPDREVKRILQRRERMAK